MILLDTDVAVDLLRQHPPATRWWASLDPNRPVLVPGYVALELVDGCHNTAQITAVSNLLRPVRIVWLDAARGDRALRDYSSIRLANALDPMDVLIAHTALALGIELQTFNQKHYSAVPGLRTVQPYVR